ncbi:hypothetical protein Hanom_Chr11g01056141 [Helianthus anomalus]
MAMGICRQGSLSGGELGREISSAVRGTLQLPFFLMCPDCFLNITVIKYFLCVKKLTRLPICTLRVYIRCV